MRAGERTLERAVGNWERIERYQQGIAARAARPKRGNWERIESKALRSSLQRRRGKHAATGKELKGDGEDVPRRHPRLGGNWERIERQATSSYRPGSTSRAATGKELKVERRGVLRAQARRRAATGKELKARGHSTVFEAFTAILAATGKELKDFSFST